MKGVKLLFLIHSDNNTKRSEGQFTHYRRRKKQFLQFVFEICQFYSYFEHYYKYSEVQDVIEYLKSKHVYRYKRSITAVFTSILELLEY